MKESTLFLSEQELQKLVKGLAKEINHEYKNIEDPLILICPLKGSLFFTADLVRQLQVPFLLDFISIETKPQGNFYISKDIQIPLKNRQVLILKEILNAGRKLLFLKKRIEASSPATIKIATLIDKPSQRQLDLHSDFFGLSTEDRYIFGYGLDHEEKFRNLRDLHVFTQ
ncbi:MAG: phosphoribosyltransferase [Bdellovibrionales bacterium]